MNRLNALSEQLAKLDFAKAPAVTMGELKREEHSVYNSTILHELYFESLGEAPTRPSGVFAEALARDFGSLDRWRAEFAATGKALDGGSGWVILTYAPRDKRLFNHWCADDGMAPAGGVPLLALDMDKHALRDGLRRRGRQIRRQLHADDPLDDARAPVSRRFESDCWGRSHCARGNLRAEVARSLLLRRRRATQGEGYFA